MLLRKLIFPILCAGTAVLAQAVGDLNALASAASRYAAHGVAGTRRPVKLDLREIKGESALLPGELMTRALDVQRWTFFYDVSAQPGDGDTAPEAGFRSASCKCVSSLFSDFHLSPKPIPGAKSLEYTWAAVSVDQAIQQLNLQGYVRGFSEVKLMRPDQPGIPDGFVYIFDCPWERTLVAISASTGETAWLEQY